MSCPVLSCPALPCPVLSCPVVSAIARVRLILLSTELLAVIYKSYVIQGAKLDALVRDTLGHGTVDQLSPPPKEI